MDQQSLIFSKQVLEAPSNRPEQHIRLLLIIIILIIIILIIIILIIIIKKKY
jgi:hypothetical protein